MMKKITRNIIVMAVFIVIIACGSKSTEVKVHFTKGQNNKVLYKISQKTTINDTLNYNIEYIALYNLIPLDKYSARVIIDSLYYSSSDGSTKLAYDSESNDSKHFLKVFLSELKGKSFSLKLNQELKVDRVFGLNDVITRTADKLHNMPGNLNLKDVVIKQFNDNAVTEEFKRIFDTISSGSIKPGMKWNYSGQKRTGLSIDTDEDYAVGKISVDMGRIEISGKLSSVSENGENLIVLKGKSNGHIIYQLENTNFWAGTLNQSLDGEGIYPDSKKEYSVIINSTINYTIGNLKK